MNAKILTHTGIMFDLLRPDPAKIVLADIAHALSRLARFTGHGDRIFTVAQHSVLVSDLAPEPLKRWALLHDAAEAYAGDMSSPLKSAMRRITRQAIFQGHVVSDYDHVYLCIEAAVAERFGVEVADVSGWDIEAQLQEVDLNGPHSSPNHCWQNPQLELVVASCEVWSPNLARANFLQRAAELGIK